MARGSRMVERDLTDEPSIVPGRLQRVQGHRRANNVRAQKGSLGMERQAKAGRP